MAEGVFAPRVKLSLAQQGQRGPRNRLHDAAAGGSVERTVALLSSGLIDIDQGEPGGWTPLMCAVEKGHAPVARMLLSKGANVAIVNDYGFTALLLAAQYNHVPIIKMLIEAGADMETASPQGLTPLHDAADQGRSEAVRALIEAGANPDSRMPDGETPLYLAAQVGYLDAIRELLRAEANPLLTKRMPSGAKRVPLHAAVEQGHSEVARELIYQLGIEGCCGKSGAVEVLCLAARYQHVDILVMLMEAGVIDTGAGLVHAVLFGLEAAVKLLLQQKKGEATGGSAYVNFRGPGGETPLLSCILRCQSCSPRVARLLVDAGADTTSAVRFTTEWHAPGVFEGTPLDITNSLLRVKLVLGDPATDEQLHKLEAIRRLLLLQVAAVHAVSWLWPSAIPLIAHAADRPGRARMASPPLTVMLPILRRRASRRGVPLSTLFRYSSKLEPGSTREV